LLFNPHIQLADINIFCHNYTMINIVELVISYVSF
jgi:hypothetical protein